MLYPEPGCNGLRRDQIQTYYRVVVRRGSLDGVPLGAKYSVYLAMMKELARQSGQELPLEDEAEEEEEAEPTRGRIVGARDLVEWVPEGKRL